MTKTMQECVVFWKLYCAVNEQRQESLQLEADEWLEWMRLQGEKLKELSGDVR